MILNIEPVVSFDDIFISPFIKIASSFAITKPRPEPPYFRVVFSSTCVKGVNNFEILLSEIPIPVSWTFMTKSIFISNVLINLTRTNTYPVCVNLMALLIILTNICLIFNWSPTKNIGISFVIKKDKSKFLKCACPIIISITCSINICKLKFTCSNSNFSADIFEKSNISFTTFNKISPDSIIVVTISVCSAVKFIFSKMLAIPIIPFIGVRNSWLILAKKLFFVINACSNSFFDISNSFFSSILFVISLIVAVNIFLSCKKTSQIDKSILNRAPDFFLPTTSRP